MQYNTTSPGPPSMSCVVLTRVQKKFFEKKRRVDDEHAF